ncbi:methionyl-tRNA formyltransferase [Candidatus Parcubacteria bacterium 4484_255]|nr:MAG: methionyl-tRNA formyltransferase [Candidatus Parcubacteria bacterium 4484_255]
MENKQCKIIFFGTPEFSAIILDKLINNQFKPIAVVTAPDKPKGRKQILTPSQTKKLSVKENIPVFQPAFLKNNPRIIKELSNLRPDLFIVAAYGLILPLEILNIPHNGCINVHPSLLPKYRGASPIQQTILNGDKKTGTTLILMDEKMDHGPILAQRELEIRNSKSEILNKSQILMTKITYPELNAKLAILSANLLINILPKFLAKKIKIIKQNHKQATFVKRINKSDGKIDWAKSASEIERMTRAYHPWPGAWTTLTTKKLKIIRVEILKINHKEQPGTIFSPVRQSFEGQNLGGTENKIPAVACGKNALILKEIQLAGKNIITGKEFINGYPQLFGSVVE